ncbi:MAG TPA: flavin reductase family protein [bacterium]|jgi:flavin reductase (DIM6/NTAB) family NADH-FMN oxidoreductase RutF
MSAAVPFDPRSFRNALGRFATGVTVVTVSTGDGVHGMTANAFTSVSLEPPLVLLSVAQHARMHGYLTPTTRFGISVLSEDQQAYAWNFAGRPQEGLRPIFIQRDGVPVVEHALAHLICSVDALHPGGDHTLVLGRVEALWYRDGSPLTFCRGRFFGLIPLPSGEWAPGVEPPQAGDEADERWLLDPWW